MFIFSTLVLMRHLLAALDCCFPALVSIMRCPIQPKQKKMPTPLHSSIKRGPPLVVERADIGWKNQSCDVNVKVLYICQVCKVYFFPAESHDQDRFHLRYPKWLLAQLNHSDQRLKSNHCFYAKVKLKTDGNIMKQCDNSSTQFSAKLI